MTIQYPSLETRRKRAAKNADLHGLKHLLGVHLKLFMVELSRSGVVANHANVPSRTPGPFPCRFRTSVRPAHCRRYISRPDRPTSHSFDGFRDAPDMPFVR